MDGNFTLTWMNNPSLHSVICSVGVMPWLEYKIYNFYGGWGNLIEWIKVIEPRIHYKRDDYQRKAENLHSMLYDWQIHYHDSIFEMRKIVRKLTTNHDITFE